MKRLSETADSLRSFAYTHIRGGNQLLLFNLEKEIREKEREIIFSLDSLLNFETLEEIKNEIEEMKKKI